MQVREIMTPGVRCARLQDTIAKAAEQMRDLDVGSLPVCGDDDKLVGMITDRDITIRATAFCCGPAETVVGQVMTPELVYCFDDQDVTAAADVNETPVQDEAHRLLP